MSTDPRPTKRQRRSAVEHSDFEPDDEPIDTSLPLRRSIAQVRQGSASFTSSASSSQARAANGRRGSAITVAKPSSARSSPKTSPQKTRKSQKLSIDETNNKSLHTFFGKATEEERWHKRSITPDLIKREDTLEDDIIDDEFVDDDLSEAIRRSKEDFRREEKPVLQSKSTATGSYRAAAPPTSSQRFRKPVPSGNGESLNGHNAEANQVDVKPWAERFSPLSLEELAVHKKKIQDVQKWIDDSLAGRIRQRILVLKGPAGSGKSTTVQLISQARKCELVAWQNPDTSESGALSSSLQFAEFVTRGGEYGALSLSGDALVPDASVNGRILLVEEFPASMTRNSNAQESFRSVLTHAASTPGTALPFTKKAGVAVPPPIILVISETLVSSSTAFSDSFTAQRLLGSDLINHPSICVIEFNPVAPTYLSKALDLVIRKEARESKRRRIPGPVILQTLAEMGDVRNAINSLQFLCTWGDDTTDWSGTVAANAKRGAKSHQPLSSMEANSLKLISSRETTLDMFHAAGKVCYNKREDPRVSDTRAEPPPKPPDHLNHLHRPKISQVDIEGLLNETGTDIQTFVSTVHQNYILSCAHNDFVDYFDGCAEVLSDAELLDPDTRTSLRSRARASATRNTVQLGNADSLRQDEISFQVATRGILFNLPFPVSRASPPGGGKGAAFKMFYPASLRLWRPIEEINGMIEVCTAQLSGQVMHHRRKTGETNSVTSWSSRANAFETRSAPDQDDESTTPPTYSNLSKDSLVLETFPYLAKIKSSRDEDVTILKKITHLQGFNAATEEEPDEDDNSSSMENNVIPAAMRLTQKVEAAHQSLRAQAQAQARVQAQMQQRAQQQASLIKKQSSSTEEPPLEKLYIEEDDIEDD